MASSDSRITEAELQAYIDGVLEPKEASRVAAHLAVNRADAERVRAYHAQAQALRDMLAQVEADAVPPKARTLSRRLYWRLTAFRTIREFRWPTLGFTVIAVALAVYLLGQRPDFVDEAVNAHRLYAQDRSFPVEVAAENRQRLLAWLSERLGEPVGPPMLEALGLKLLGGRLVANDDLPAAQFTYEDLRGNRVTVFVAPEHVAATEVSFDQDDDVAVAYWSDGAFSYVIVARADESVRKVAPLVATALRSRDVRR